MTREEICRIALWQLRYPTSAYWLRIANNCYIDGYYTVEKLVARIKLLEPSPKPGRGPGALYRSASNA